MSLLKSLWDGWKVIGHYIGDFQARWLLTVFYFTVAVPFALLTRHTDPLALGELQGRSGWLPRALPDDSLERAHRQY